ncbi:FtsK/SpoIIIE domain-containing protein [Anaerococcus sp.]|uniref:FtsK/SpoIIIE domain-containing protein n=1 Tax=Anaerococcus sp. TaxID=1872515 RepID=UPI0028FF24E3|nr:FtsK/SpoIIIE domain-containing protein [Anaerococcus sp.]MDU3212356.1 FtsK/SpoIIIE domain-containing protein [Anaerococcus sp.]
MRITKRDVRKITSLFVIVMSILGYTFFKWVYPSIKFFLENDLKILIMPDVNVNIFIFLIFTVILSNILSCLIRHHINNGLKYSYRHYKLEKELRKQLIYLDFDIKNKSRIVVLPKILIKFEDKELLSCEIKIQNLVKFDKNLETLRLNASLGNYILISQQVLTKDGNWYIFKCKHLSALKQITFYKKDDYLNWSSCDSYKYRISNTDYFDITHAAISGKTGSGKTYYLQSVLLQLMNKDIPADIKIVDPKHADLYFFGLRYLDEKNVSDKVNAVNLISNFYREMQERQEELSDFFRENPNSDYKDAKKQAKILIIDEFGSLRSSFKNLAKKDRDNLDSILSDIAFVGRQLGCFLWLATQQFNHLVIPTQLTEQMSTKIVLGSSDDQTYRNLFSQSVVIPNIKLKPGYGYFSYPGIANIQNPLLFVSPYCKFLKDSQA